MKGFRIKTYTLSSSKVKKTSGPVRFCFLSDLHSSVFGPGNQTLVKAIQDRRPDGILVGGDCMVGKYPVAFQAAQELLVKLARICPLWYAPGNHESRVRRYPQRYGEGYEKYEACLREAGVRFLYNEREAFSVRDSRFAVYGLELEEAYFQKPRPPALSPEHIRRLLGEKGPGECYHILLAHNPKFGDAYFSWGADLILSGHYHGGLVRFGAHHGLAAPQALFWPRYCCGDFYRGEQAMAVSAGLGEHTLPIRIWNPREVIEIIINGENGG